MAEQYYSRLHQLMTKTMRPGFAMADVLECISQGFILGSRSFAILQREIREHGVTRPSQLKDPLQTMRCLGQMLLALGVGGERELYTDMEYIN